MAVQTTVFSQLMLSNYRAAMVALNPSAVPTSQQEILITAICTGLIKVLKTTKVVSIVPFEAVLVVGPSALNGIGLLVDPDLMFKVGMQTMQLLLGGPGGQALQPALQAIMITIATYFLVAVEVVSISGFGGQALPPVNMTAQLIQAAIIEALPVEWQQSMGKSKNGMDFIKSISTGISAGMVIGIPGPVPVDGTPLPVGALIAKFQ